MPDGDVKSRLLYEGAEWDFDTIKRTYDAIEDIALNELGLDCYPNQIEVITSEQMLDAYSSIGMPLMYHHWSYGKHFARDEMMYRKGYSSLAYEIVINSNPVISYIMEENGMTMQTLVMAHAAFGHNHFFKNNYLFKQWTDADGILDYLSFAKNYVSKCEERYGLDAVESILDAAHALMDQGVNRYRHPSKPKLPDDIARQRQREEYEQRTYNDLWRTLPKAEEEETDPSAIASKKRSDDRRAALGLPEENLLYFLEKNAPKLAIWERELLHIVRNIAQYFYPQRQTKMMNEGCACFVHYAIMNRLYDKGLISEGAILEFIDSHAKVVFQPEFDDKRFSGINPYALGFAMMKDIERICTDPTDEDREWFPDFAGNQDPLGTLKDAWASYRDESFILQFLSPHLMRELRLFSGSDISSRPHLRVDAIHNESGYREVRRKLAAQYDVVAREPDIQVVDVDLSGDRTLILQHTQHRKVRLDRRDSEAVLGHLARLWGYDVKLQAVDGVSGEILQEQTVSPNK